MRTILATMLICVLLLPSASWAHDHCPPPPSNECKAPGPYPKQPNTSDCEDLARRIEQAKEDIEELEIAQQNLRLQLQAMADRDVTDAEMFLAQLVLTAVQVPGTGIKKAGDVVQWLGEQVIETAFGEIAGDAFTPDGFNVDPSFEGMSVEDLSRLAAAVTVAISLRYGELNALETAIADCWRLKEQELQAFDKAVAEWDLNTFTYEQCMKAHKRAMRRWQRRCDE